MEAANRGAKEGGGYSVGFNIALPHEQQANPYIDLGITFRHFYARKVALVKAAEGFILFPGGFGTLDELFESLTLIQTDKVRQFPVVLLRRAYWRDLLDWIADEPLAAGMISPEDVDLLHVTDDVDEAVAAGGRLLGTALRRPGSRARKGRRAVAAAQPRVAKPKSRSFLTSL